MPSAAAMVACRPVPQACWMSKAGVYDDSELPSTHSRIRLKSRLCLSTAPPMTAPSFSPGQIEAVDQPAQRGGEHVLVGGVGVRAVRACERDSVAAKNAYAAARCVGHGGHTTHPSYSGVSSVSWLPTCTRKSSIRHRETSSPSSSASRSPRRCAATVPAIRRWPARCSSAVRAASSNRCAARSPRTTTWCRTISAGAGPTRSAGWCSTPPASPSRQA